MVKTEDGDKPIEEIKAGDKVWAYDEETGKKELKEVVQLFRNETRFWYTNYIKVDGEDEIFEITTTTGHKYYLPFLHKTLKR